MNNHRKVTSECYEKILQLRKLGKSPKYIVSKLVPQYSPTILVLALNMVKKNVLRAKKKGTVTVVSDEYGRIVTTYVNKGRI
jgi:hypothetical protein